MSDKSNAVLRTTATKN